VDMSRVGERPKMPDGGPDCQATYFFPQPPTVDASGARLVYNDYALYYFKPT
jgi:hypothetical protein